MFLKKCWRKKVPVNEATGLRWEPIVEPNVDWPKNQPSKSTTETVPVVNGDGKPDVPENIPSNQMQTLQIEIVDKPMFAKIVKNMYTQEEITTNETSVIPRSSDKEMYTIAQQETIEVEKAKMAQVINNNDNDIYQVTYSEWSLPLEQPDKVQGVENIPTIMEDKPDKFNPDVLTMVDDNANHIQVNTIERNTLDIDFRNSSASLLSTTPSDTYSSGSLTHMTRRKGLRDDDEQSVDLQVYDITPEEKAIVKKALTENDFFMAVASNVADDIAQYMIRREVVKGDIIMKQGEDGYSMYVSKQGDFKIQRNKQTIKKFKGGCLFGELAILYGTPRAATAIATSNGTVWELSRHIFKKLHINANKRILEFLTKVPIINQASPEKLRKIAELCDNRYYPKDTVIIREGQRGDEFFLVKTGSALVSKLGQGKLKIYTSGDFFGERALLHDDDKRTATVIAIDYGVECLVLKRQDFNIYLGDVHKFLQEDIGPRKEILKLPKPSDEKLAPYKPIQFKDLEIGKPLGEGGFGKVYRAKWNKKFFALKTLKIQDVKKNKAIKKVMNERDIQIACDCEFIVKLYRTFEDSQNYYFLLEFCPRAELWPLIQTVNQKKKKHFTHEMSRFSASCVLEALAYLHKHNCAYLDLKPENIFIDKQGYPKLGDFGNAVQLKPGEQIVCFAGTPAYMAPEIIQYKGTDIAADYWAFGVLIYEMLLGKAPFDDKDTDRLFANIIGGLTSKHFPPNFDKRAHDLIKRLIHVNPSRRLGCLRDGVIDVYKHDFFKEVEFEELRTKKLKSPLLALYKN